jgi:hypothetical protein
VNSIVRRSAWFLTLVLASVVAGCGSGGGNAILGNTGVAATTGLSPGAVCPTAGSTNPVLLASDPTNGNQFATTSTTGVANSGKNITATFSLPLTASSITATSFTVTPAGGIALVPASFTYVLSTSVATFTTTSALLPNTNYTAVVTTAITSSTGVPMACSYSWSFKTAATATVGVASVNLATATPFAIASSNGLTNTSNVPLTHINGDVVMDPNTTCNTVSIDTTGGMGPCNGFAPTLTGTVISPLFNKGITSTTIITDLRTAYNNLTPGILQGAIPLGCPTIGSGGGAGALLGCAGNSILPPGVYIASSSTSIGVTGTLTLDGQGDSNARFVFQAGSSLTTAAGAPGAPGSQIVLINGAKASNVWWQVGSSATIGTYSVFVGNVLADTSITMHTSSTSCGRLLAGAVNPGAFVFDTNIVSVPGNAFAPAGCQ